jgi:hypothetical protein
VTAPAPSLRDRIAAALVATPSTGWTYTPGQEKWDHHRRAGQPGHRYSITCALCVGDIYALADAVLPLLADAREAGRRDGLREVADDLDADADQLGPDYHVTAGYRSAADRLRARADTTHPGGQP